MLEWIALLCLLGALALLFLLSTIDIKTRLLPNEMVLGFATLGLVFHLTTMGQFIEIYDIAIGAAAAFSILYLIRMVANFIYKTDALGLGDIKLMTAGGLWLGLDALMIALVAGSTASLLHGLVYAHQSARKTKKKIPLSQLQIPAGPGFAAGLVIAGIWKFREFSPF
jgi:leader peptidase (prepilin peptidase) / N-methyltransferase